MSKGKNLTLFVVIVSFLLFLDQSTKILAYRLLENGNEIVIFPFLKFDLTFNTGAAFSFLAGESGWQLYLFATIAVSVSAWMCWAFIFKNICKLTKISFILISAGALGNLIDRIKISKVIDFISVHYENYFFPTFNVADVFISIGAALLIYSELKADADDKRAVQP
ncbi:hypothetical protein RJ44_15140 [Alteromonas macleodii]|uniref:signal peptidase II n=1 Tax=Alteromonas macleodii TaxID=28108 RepID=UPI00057C505C|nr:signal peptidase II [Alteromonas macleodii]KHT57752.1 hypothetical protein RJ44_15140 [Alteromonas macleodii]